MMNESLMNELKDLDEKLDEKMYKTYKKMKKIQKKIGVYEKFYNFITRNFSDKKVKYQKDYENKDAELMNLQKARDELKIIMDRYNEDSSIYDN